MICPSIVPALSAVLASSDATPMLNCPNSHHVYFTFSTLPRNFYPPLKPSRIPVPPIFPHLSLPRISRLQFSLQSHSDEYQTSEATNTEDEENLRTHNGRSALVLGILDSLDEITYDEKEEEEEEQQQQQQQQQHQQQQQTIIEMEDLSLVNRRTPRFPGAIFPSSVSGNSKTLIQAIVVRRAVAADLLKEAMRVSKFSLTYSSNLVSRMSKFVDLVLIEAAALKRNSDFSHLNFNARVNIYIQRSGVIPLVK